MKIKAQIFFMGLLLSVLPMGLVSVLLITFYNRELDNVAVDNLISITSAQIDIIDNFFYDCDINMSTLADFDMLHDLLDKNLSDDEVNQQEKIMMEDIFRAQKEKRSFLYSITALNADFEVMACSEPIIDNGAEFLKDNLAVKEMNQEIWFSHILEAGEFGTSNRCLVAIKAVDNEQDERIGYLVEEIALDVFADMRVETKLIKAGTVYITDGAGGIISAGTGAENRHNFVLEKDQRSSFNDVWKSRDLGQDVGVIRYEAAGKNYLSSYGGFKNAGWQIISTVCLDDILHTRENYTAVLIIAGIVTVLLIITVNLAIRRMITAPIEKMVRAFNYIREKRDFSKRIEDIPHNEVGQIAGEVNILLDDIENTLNHQKKRLAFLKERAERDPLTGLFNRNAINEVFTVKIDNACANRELLACVLVDIDDFKDFNTQYGHAGGDRVIQFVAELMREVSADTAGRLGGDEFVMCLSCFASEGELQTILTEFSGRLMAGIEIEGGGGKISVPCSVGTVLLRGDSVPSVDSVLENADKAMYHVKNGSKSDFCIVSAYHPSDCSASRAHGKDEEKLSETASNSFVDQEGCAKEDQKIDASRK